MHRVDKNIYAEGVRFACQGCGKCCQSRGKYGYVYVSLPERRRLARHLRIPVRSFTRRYCEKTDGFFHLRSQGRDCVFLEGTRCRVHRARPEQCATWPFWPENLRSRRTWRQAASECEGIERGPMVGYREICHNRDLTPDPGVPYHEPEM